MAFQVSALLLSLYSIQSLDFFYSIILFKLRLRIFFHHLSFVVILQIRDVLLMVFDPIVQFGSAFRHLSNVLLPESGNLQ